MGLFSKKKGGSFFGNLIASVANKATGGLLGAKRVAALKSGDLASINPDAKNTGKMLASFAGEEATQSEDGTIHMTKPLNEVVVSATPFSSSGLKSEPSALERLLGDKLSYLGQRATENTTVGADNKTLLVVGGGLALLVFAMVAMKK